VISTSRTSSGSTARTAAPATLSTGSSTAAVATAVTDGGDRGTQRLTARWASGRVSRRLSPSSGSEVINEGPPNW